MDKLLTIAKAQDLSYLLRCRIQDGHGKSLKLFAHVRGDRIVFTGGEQGEHSLAIEVSSAARVKAHWAGYCENNGHEYAKVGQRVEFPSSSSPDGFRTGRVSKVGPDRTTVKFRYKHGGESQKTLPKHQCRLIPG